jgi:positive regulator of sigma E activity
MRLLLLLMIIVMLIAIFFTAEPFSTVMATVVIGGALWMLKHLNQPKHL